MPNVSPPHVGRVVVILPALNEAEAIGGVLTRMPRNELKAQGYALSVWVVDGKSKDATRDVAMSNGAGILVQRGSGKGNAMTQAFDFFVEPEVNPPAEQPASQRYFIMLDSDGTYPPEAIPSFVNALDEGYDVVMGSRFQGLIETGALTDLNRFGNRALTRFASFLFRAPVTDVCTGMWGLSERFLRRFVSTANGFDLEADIFASACNEVSRMTEVPISYARRIGTPKLVPIRTGLQIAWRLLLRWMRREDTRLMDPTEQPTGGAS
ncbi:MAG: glycosyltransferase family 2 protein [bacterium]